ncbi:protein of unknown function [Taphrina deformans PYCC 5710]|uniref:OTU domain-containing protein n=1 Tax=Taphrina deformans (strain PYCC 5710 / ATCC 11124 / CBS 356.35 / IMI 108563 / JCM 9778 / NBRC 8474) TaxID=1097556 RepID=R4XDX5_TAPDE|nr:protein of unknown function [Taphrina deformans PYCC 5710]|eukprot:CCG83852.1 protein of unknown function [Taphrina deformans PYCC 5710]
MSSAAPKKKVNRAKARLERRAAEMEAQRQEAAAEAANMPDLKARESQQMNNKLESMGLVEHNINADGHCLYSAFAHQLARLELSDETYKSLRTKAAEYMRRHPEDFIPFLSGQDLDEVSLEAYTNELENTPRWGGEMEIIALAREFSVAVTIIQPQGNLLKFEETNSKGIMMTRYEHMYSLGAHFNSVNSK